MPRPDMLFINPETCIDCQACVVECPVEAIFDQDDVPEEFAAYIALNREMVEEYPVVQ